VTYVEEQWTGWWAGCDTCDWKAGPCDTEAEAHAHADQHDLAMREVKPAER
jgi:hypothetical protein